MKKGKKANPRAGRRWAALFLLLVLAGGGAALWQISDVMAEGTRCGQVFASVTPQDGVLEFTLMGQSGSLPYAAWGQIGRASCRERV